MEILNDKEILKEYNMKNLIRFNTRNRITNEDIAQHSFFVALFCLKIFRQLELDTETKLKILTKAILHDVCEEEISDVPYVTKEKYPNLKALMESLEKEYYDKHWPEYKELFNKENVLIDNIVRLADIYSVRQYSLNECNLGNSTLEMKGILYNTETRIRNQITKIEKEI